MNARYYYAFADSLPARDPQTGSRASFDSPLAVNCAGNMVASEPFATQLSVGREDYYLLYMVTGSLRLWLPDGEHTISSGSVVLFPPHYPYRYTYDGASPLSYLWVHFTGSHAERFLGELGFGALPCLRETEGEGKISNRFLRLFEGFEDPGPFKRQELACALEALLLTVARSLVSAESNRPLDRSIRYIHAAYHTEIRVPELARMENLSNSRYIALFGKQMGMPPSAYIVRLRVNTACDLLRGTDMSIKQIGAMVGYEDAHFFSRTFKRHVGVSPQAYRQTH